MPKVIQSPVKKFPGTVTLSDPLTLPQVVIIDDCLMTRRDFFEEVEDGDNRVYKLKPGMFWSKSDSLEVAAIVQCVDEWSLKGFPEKVTAETFPGSPRSASQAVINWLLTEIMNVYQGETEIPNE